MPTPTPENPNVRPLVEELEPQTTMLQIIVAVLLVGAASILGSIVVPTLLALILAIALSPVVSWLERKGVPTTLGSLACMLSVATVLGLTLGLMIYQAGTVLQNSDQYIEGVANMIARVSGQTGGDEVMRSLGLLNQASQTESQSSEGKGQGGEADRDAGSSGGEAAGETESKRGGTSAGGGSVGMWEQFLRRNLQTVGSWVTSGHGGLLGFGAGLVIFLAFLFYMLQTRVDWMGRLTLAFARLGLRPKLKHMGESQKQIEVFVGFVSLVAFCYMVISSAVYWLIGLPTPLLWGLLTGLLEFIPFFGPTIAGSMAVLVALTLGTLWQPLAVVGFFVGLHLVEGYVITPMVYGSAVKIDPVTTLLGILFFGWIWGPLGSMVAMPTMILLRGLVVMAPDTPALDALVDVEARKNEDRIEDGVPTAPGDGGNGKGRE